MDVSPPASATVLEPDAGAAAGFASLRASLYRYYAVAFLLPDDGRRRMLIEAGRALADFAGFPFVLPLREFVDTLEATDGKQVEDTYRLLFLTPPVLFPLLAAAYTASNGTSGMEGILTAYRRLGIRGNTASGVRDDHVSVMLEGLATVAAREIEAVETNDGSGATACREQSRGFLEGLVIPILVRLRAGLEVEAPGSVYHALALSAHAFAVHDARALCALLEVRA